MTKRDFYKLGLIEVFLVSLYFGLADSDWYWQIKLGESIVKHGKFNDFSQLVWGSDLGYYLDHEWLSNVVFYLVSLLPFGVLITKGLLVGACLLSVYYFTKSYDKDNSTQVVIGVLLVMFVCSLTVFKIKPYMFSFVFMIAELYFLRKKNKVGLTITGVLWLNMHGSYPLFLVIFVLYMLVMRCKKLIPCFLVNLVSTGFTPFGYKLVIFDLLHNNDKVMKVLIRDWRAVDCKEPYGVFVFITILVFIFILRYARERSSFGVLLSVAMLFLTMCSARHMLYFAVSFVYLLCVSDVECKLLTRKVLVGVTYIALIFGVSSVFGLVTMQDFSKSYEYQVVDNDTVSKIKTYSGESGFFANSVFNSLLGYDIKTFTCGIYPLVSDRVKDEIYLTYYASPQETEDIIEYYGLTSFLVDKHSQFEGYSRNSALYQYLSSSSSYRCVSDKENYAFFVSKTAKSRKTSKN